VKCYVCGKKIRKSQAYVGDEGAPLEGKNLCEDCYYEDEPCATVLYSKDDTPYIISHARNETEGEFKVKWHSTDPWRGYYETESDNYALVNTAELLAYHESEKMLKSFDERVRELFDEHGIEYARVFARSSNVFYQNYDFYVRKDQALLASLLVAKAKSEVDYDNPKWYRNIVFDEFALKKLTELFPEREIKTNYDAVKLVEELGDNTFNELRKRMNKKEVVR
jgi:ribosome-binding protein aMBF1 (putative translation factor)